MCLRLQWLVIRAQPQILRRQIRIHHFVRIQFIAGVPDGFEFREGLHDFRTKHFGEQGATRLSVAMFTGKRTTVADHKICSAINELPIISNAFFTLKIETYAHVDAAMPEMSVK